MIADVESGLTASSSCSRFRCAAGCGGQLGRVDLDEERGRVLQMPTDAHEHDDEHDANDHVEHERGADEVVQRPVAA